MAKAFGKFKCVALGCEMNTFSEERKCGQLSFHSFPKDKALKQQWLLNLGMPNFEVRPVSYVCSKHFTQESYHRNAEAFLKDPSVVQYTNKLLKNACPTILTCMVPSTGLFSSPAKLTLESPSHSRKRAQTSEGCIQLLQNPVKLARESLSLSKKRTQTSEESTSCNESYCELSMKVTKDTEVSELTSKSNQGTIEESTVYEPKYIVFDSQLNELLCRVKCKKCTTMVDVNTIVKSTQEGSLLSVKYNCLDGHENVWKSQPLLGKIPAGNLLIAACVLLTGCIFHQIQSFFKSMGLTGIGKTMYFSIQRDILLPEIKTMWSKQQSNLLSKIRNKKTLNISADAQCDTSGHFAKYCTYTLLDQETDKCLHFELIQKFESDFKSTNMELEGLKRCFKKMKEEKIEVTRITTNRHIQVVNYLKKFWPKIIHQFDIWHMSKSVRAKLVKLASEKEHAQLKDWIKSVCSHLWYSAQNCQKNADVLIDMWKSVTFHLINRHYFPSLKYFKKCEHEKLSKEEIDRKKWVVMNSPTHLAFESLVNDKWLLKDLIQINEFSHKSALKSYHSLMKKYCNKQRDFNFNVMEARTILAILDHNYNTEQKLCNNYMTNKNKAQDFSFYYSKATTEWHARPLREPKSYAYMYNLLQNIVKCQLSGEAQAINVKRKFPQNIAPIPCPDKANLINEAKKRIFELN